MSKISLFVHIYNMSGYLGTYLSGYLAVWVSMYLAVWLTGYPRVTGFLNRELSLGL